MENGLKISQLAAADTFADDDLIPVARGAGNARVPGAAFQSRLFRPDIMRYTESSGVFGTTLASLPTVGRLNELVLIILPPTTELQFWLLTDQDIETDVAGTSGSTVRPDDYHGIDNIKTWMRIL